MNAPVTYRSDTQSSLRCRKPGGGTQEMTDWYLKSETGPLLDVDAQPRPLLLLELFGNVRRAGRQIPDVPDARLDDVVGAEKFLEGLRLGGRFDDYEALGHLLLRVSVGEAPTTNPPQGSTPEGKARQSRGSERTGLRRAPRS